jgi:hypothetical protein
MIALTSGPHRHTRKSSTGRAPRRAGSAPPAFPAPDPRPSPVAGTMVFRERYQFDSPDAITIIGEMQQGDRWVAFTTTRLVRRR